MNKREQFIHQQRNLLMNDVTGYITENTAFNHIRKSHLHITDAELLDTIVSNQKFSDARFTDEKTMFGSIAIALHDSMPDIADYVLSPKTERMVIEFDASPYFEKVGSGYVAESRRKESMLEYGQRINAAETAAITLVLSKDSNQPNGFIVATAYPTTNPQSLRNADKLVKTTSQDLTPTLERTYTYRSEYTSPLCKIGLRAACHDPTYNNCRIDYRKNDAYNPQEQIYITPKTISPLDRPPTVILNRDGRRVHMEFCKSTLKTVKPGTYKTLVHSLCSRNTIEMTDYDLVMTADAAMSQIESMTYIPANCTMPTKRMVARPPKRPTVKKPKPIYTRPSVDTEKTKDPEFGT